VADNDDQMIASAADEPSDVGEPEGPEYRLPADVPLVWSSMDFPDMDDGE
jgi:hypothetical protein